MSWYICLIMFNVTTHKYNHNSNSISPIELQYSSIEESSCIKFTIIIIFTINWNRSSAVEYELKLKFWFYYSLININTNNIDSIDIWIERYSHG